MAKAGGILRNDQKEFYKTITGICERKAAWQVWSDFIECSAISLSNWFDREGKIHDGREKRYLEIMRGYTPQEQKGLVQLLTCLMEALEMNPNQDFLGDMYMALELHSHWHGQFFTPYHMSHFMAKIIISKDDEALRERGWIGVNDPACGAGSLLIAVRNICQEAGIGFRQVLFIAQDIDRVAALMCYLQLSLLGCAGYVVVGNSLLRPLTSYGSALLPAYDPQHEVWFTPVFYDEVWQDRIRLEVLKHILYGVPDKKASKALSSDAKRYDQTTPQGVSPTPHCEEVLVDGEHGQLRLF